MRRRLPAPAPAVRKALALLPHSPGVYLFRDERGRVVYVGRSRDLATRARSYWTDLGDRPHLVRMLDRVAWVEPFVCTSEHEAAILESDLLERHPSRYNRTLGMESWVWLRLDLDPDAPGLEVRHEPDAGDGATWFGPYLGWEPTRQAAAGLLRLHPLRHAGRALDRSQRELARSLGVGERDREQLGQAIARVLRREPAALRDATDALRRARDRAASELMFENAAAIQEQMRGLAWIAQPQKLSLLDAVDRDYAASATVAGTEAAVVLSIRRGRLEQRHVAVVDRACRGEDAVGSRPGRPSVAGRSGVDPSADAAQWSDVAAQNAMLMAAFAAAGVLGPTGWSSRRR